MEENIAKTAKEIGKLVAAYFKENGLTYKVVAARLGYASPQVITNQLGGKKFGNRVAEKYAEQFGFNQRFLMTGKGELIIEPSEEPEEESINIIIEENKNLKQRINIMEHMILSQQETINRLSLKAVPV